MSRSFILFVLVLGCMTMGCKPAGKGLKVEYVEGKVTLDGTEVEGAFITFYPTGTTGESAGGVSGPQGIYKLTSENGDIDKGALAGSYKVTVRKVESKNFLNDDGTFAPGAPIDPATGQKLGTKQTNLLPVQYSFQNKTPLNVTVAPGKNTINLELKSKP